MTNFVTHIEATPIKHMQHLVASPDGLTGYLTEVVVWQTVCTVGLGTLEVSDELTDGCRLFTTRLTYTTPQRPAPVAEPQAYRLTLADGRQLVVGVPMRPYPLTTITDTHEGKASGAAACQVKVEMKNAMYGPVELIEVG